jgi:hypothetical protein
MTQRINILIAYDGSSCADAALDDHAPRRATTKG